MSTRKPVTIWAVCSMVLLCAGATAQETPAGGAAGEAADAATLAALVETGQGLYGRNCASCHGDAGQGGSGPALAGYAPLEKAENLVGQIVYGGSFMPSFPNLSHSEIAAIATYVRNSFGNTFGIVTEEDVAGMQ